MDTLYFRLENQELTLIVKSFTAIGAVNDANNQLINRGILKWKYSLKNAKQVKIYLVEHQATKFTCYAENYEEIVRLGIRNYNIIKPLITEVGFCINIMTELKVVLKRAIGYDKINDLILCEIPDCYVIDKQVARPHFYNLVFKKEANYDNVMLFWQRALRGYYTEKAAISPKEVEDENRRKIVTNPCLVFSKNEIFISIWKSDLDTSEYRLQTSYEFRRAIKNDQLKNTYTITKKSKV